MSAAVNRTVISNQCKLSNGCKNVLRCRRLHVVSSRNLAHHRTILGPLSVSRGVLSGTRTLVFREKSNISAICTVLSKGRNNLGPGFFNGEENEGDQKDILSTISFEKGNDVEVPNQSDVINHDIQAHNLPMFTPTDEIFANEFTKLPLKCRSCGAFMQTEHSDAKGYILPEKLPSLLKNTMEDLICSNCYSLRYANKALSLGIDKDNVFWQFRHLTKKPALILYVVDVMDMTGSVLPEIMDLIGQGKHVIIVGNKADMLASEIDKARRQEFDITQKLKSFCIKEGLDNFAIKDVCLISGLTGHGLEKLISLINKHRDVDMDLYVVGSANVGKSTIFNKLQNLSAISKNDANIPTQAITHHIPGTSFGLIRYPIAYWRMKKVRWMLLQPPVKEEENQFEFVEDIIKEVQVRKKKLGNAETTDNADNANRNEVDDLVLDEMAEFVDLHSLEKKRRWMYDTPGLMNTEQITQFLTPSELKFLNHKLWVVPKTFIIKPGRSLLLGGLARLDYCEITRKSIDDPSQDEAVPKGIQSIFITVFCSNNLPLHPTRTETASSTLEKNYGNHILKIPFDDTQRCGKFPALEPREHEITGIGWQKSSADLCIAGLGWIAVTAGNGSIVKLKLHTPNGIGQKLREDCLMPYSVNKRGRRGVRYCGRLNKNIYECTRRKNPQLVKSFDKQNEVTFSWLQKIAEKEKYQRFERKTERQRLLIEQGFKGHIRQLSEKVEMIEKEAAKLKALEAGEA